MFPVVVRLSANRAVAAVSRRVCFNGGFAEESDLVAQLRGFLEAMIAMLLVNTGGSRDDLELYLNEGLAAVYIGQGDGRQHVRSCGTRRGAWFSAPASSDGPSTSTSSIRPSSTPTPPTSGW